MARKSGQPQIQFGCIWCGGMPRSKEHVFSDWISKILPKDQNRHTNTKIQMNYINGYMFMQPKFHQPTGDILSKTLKVVCETCNKVWMREIENSAIPVLKRLILGDNDFVLSGQNIIALCEWVALKTFIFEQDDPNSAALTKLERRAFYKHRSLLGHWEFFIGQHEDEGLKKRAMHTPFALGRPQEFAALKARSRSNSQITFFGIGRVVLICASSSKTPVSQFFGANIQKLSRLSVQNEQPLNVSKLPLVNNDEVVGLTFLTSPLLQRL